MTRTILCVASVLVLSCNETPDPPMMTPAPSTWVREGTRIKNADDATEVIVHENSNFSVNGNISIEQDAKLLPRRKCVTKKLTDTSKDLGSQLSEILANYSCVNIVLPERSTWTWNEVVWLGVMQHLSISGTCPSPVSIDGLSTIIKMEKEHQINNVNAGPGRGVARLYANDGSSVYLSCLKIAATIPATLPVSVNCGAHALFSQSVVDQAGSRYRFEWIHFDTSEHIAFSSGNGIVRFNQAKISKYGTRSGDISPVTNYKGWCPSLSGTTIVRDNLNLEPGVSYVTDTSFRYLP